MLPVMGRITTFIRFSFTRQVVFEMNDINKHVLSNGLRVVHSYNPLTGIAVVNMLYNVGGKNDPRGKTGCAHLMEHLMFSGSLHVPNFDTALQNAGCENNAFTTSDITNYYDIVPAHNIETALWAESDRMAFLKLDERNLSIQKSVVIEEFKQRNLNRPYGDASFLYRKTAYRKHPYRNMVIGNNVAQINAITLDDIKEYYARYYSPDNAVLSIVGNITFDKCMKLVEKRFSPLPASAAKHMDIPEEPEQKSARRKSVERKVKADAIYKVWHMPGRNDEEYPYLDLISDILANGNSSRLKTELLRKKRIFSSIDAAVTGDMDPGLLVVSGLVLPGINIEDADKAIENEIEKLSGCKVSRHELIKVVNKFESSELFDRTDNAEYAAKLAYFELLGDAGKLASLTDRYRMVSEADILHAAEKFLRPTNCTTLLYNAV